MGGGHPDFRLRRWSWVIPLPHRKSIKGPYIRSPRINLPLLLGPYTHISSPPLDPHLLLQSGVNLPSSQLPSALFDGPSPQLRTRTEPTSDHPSLLTLV